MSASNDAPHAMQPVRRSADRAAGARRLTALAGALAVAASALASIGVVSCASPRVSTDSLETAVVAEAPLQAIVEEIGPDGRRRRLALAESQDSCASFRSLGAATALVVRACATVETRAPGAAGAGAATSWRVERFVIEGLSPGVSVGVWIALADADGAPLAIELNGAPFEVSRAMLAEGVAWVELARDGTTEVATRLETPVR
jgi:hypothetical protein